MPQGTPVATNGATPPPVSPTTPAFSPKFLTTVRAAVEAVLAERSPDAASPPDLTPEAVVAILGNDSVLEALDACIRDYLNDHLSEYTDSLIEDASLVTWDNARDMVNEGWFSDQVYGQVESALNDYDFTRQVERGIDDYDFDSLIQDSVQGLQDEVTAVSGDLRRLEESAGLSDEDNERLTGLENAVTALAAGIAPLTAFLDTLRATADLATLVAPSESAPAPEAAAEPAQQTPVADPELEQLLAEEEEIERLQRQQRPEHPENLAPRGSLDPQGYVLANASEYISSRNWTPAERLQVAWLSTDRNADGNVAVWLPAPPLSDTGTAPFGDSHWRYEEDALGFISRSMIGYNMADRRLFRGRP